jgi:hypothetical protein
MTVAAEEALAMVLPLPVPVGCAEDAVRFIDLQGYANFFADVRKGFPEPVAANAFEISRAPAPQALKVHAVGRFVASFVPRIADFDRLDERFRLPPKVFDELPLVRDYGFAVFQLRDLGGGIVRRLQRVLGSSSAEPEPIHPMAFEFPRRDPSVLFFPTVHVHDGEVHQTADFDHSLYLQAPENVPLAGWFPSTGVASTFMDEVRSQGVVSGSHRIHSRGLHGKLKNQDTLVSIAPPPEPLRAVG